MLTHCHPVCSSNPSEPLHPIAPTLLSINPTTAPVGSQTQTLVVTGTDFTHNSIVTIDGEDRPTTYISPTTLDTLLVPSIDDTPRTLQVNVRTGAHKGGDKPFQYTASTLHIESIDPDTVPIGQKAVITATGTGFINNTQILVDVSPAGRVISVNPTTLIFEIRAPSVEKSVPVTVRNGAVNGTGAPMLTFDDLNTANAATLTSLVPAALPIGSPVATIEAKGTGFTSSSVVVNNGFDEATTFVDETTLRFDVNPSIIIATQTVQISVRNGTAASNELPFNYTAADLSITAVTPNTGGITDPATPVDTVITGTGFLPNTAVMHDGAVFNTPTNITPTSMNLQIVPTGAARTTQLTVKNGLVNGTGSMPFTYTAPV